MLCHDGSYLFKEALKLLLSPEVIQQDGSGFAGFRGISERKRDALLQFCFDNSKPDTCVAPKPVISFVMQHPALRK